MEAIHHKRIFFILIGIVFFFISCVNNIEFTKYKTLEEGSWESQKNISFEFTVTDTISPKNLFINIRNNNNYGFSNLYVITELNFPNGSTVIDTLQYKMTNEKGQFLGDGFANITENKLFYKENKVFPRSGNYTMKIRHAMRKSDEIKPIAKLDGIQDVGFSIEKIK